MEKKISVIVPVYNAEKYLGVCLESIMNQTYQYFEVVLVDDGSVDGSGSICDQFVLRDRRFRVIHKENEGLISARKTGITLAKEDYIAFVDADDWVDTDFLETSVCRMEQDAADIVITGCIRENGVRPETVKNQIHPGIYDITRQIQEVYPRMLHYEGFYEFGIQPYIWNKLYKKEILESCYRDIDTRIYDGEDVAVVYPYLLKAKKTVITEDAKYHYRIHGESMTANRKADFYENSARLYLYLVSEFRKTAYFECMMPQLDQYMRMMIWQGNPTGLIESTKIIFPFKDVPRGALVILYGAGYAGRIFHHQLVLSGYCTIVAWVDRAYQQEELRKIGVVSMEALHTKVYDYVVLAVRDKDMAAEITDQLVSYGISRKKIIFCAQ